VSRVYNYNNTRRKQIFAAPQKKQNIQNAMTKHCSASVHMMKTILSPT